jgi:hypothetical protein
MPPTSAAELLRYSILTAWGVVVLGAIILRYNSDKLNGTVRRYLAYLGYVDPRDLQGPAAQLSAQNPTQSPSAGNSNSKSIAV